MPTPMIALLPVAALLAPSATTRTAWSPSARRCASTRLCASDATPFDVTVKRGEDGSLGVLVDQDNTVVTITAQPALNVGDVIVGVDGETLSGRPIGQCLTPGLGEYTFSVVRPSAADAAESLERVLLQLVREATGSTPSLLCFADDDEQAARAESLIQSLEAASVTGDLRPSVDDLGTALRSGFWRLLLVSDPALARGGLTGYGLAPFCSVLASYQAFIELKGEDTAQVVEVVANANLGTSNIAALKGSWKGAEGAQASEIAGVGGDGAPAGGVTAALEKYERTEYGGSPEIGAPEVLNAWACTYLSERLRVCRVRDGAGGEGAWRVFARVNADVAQDDIGRLLAMPVTPLPRDRPPDGWSDRGGGYGGGGGGGGGGPVPMPDAMM